MRTLTTLTLTAGLAFCAVSAQAATLYNNGPVVDASGLSIIANGGTLLAAGAQTSAANLVADDFTVTAGQTWKIESINFYAYQTGAPTFPLTSATWSVLSGSINGSVVALGTTALTDGTSVGFRVSPTTLTDTDRSIWRGTADVTDFSLASGSYWLTWSLAGSATFSGPWQPPTSDGAVGNAMQSLSGAAFKPLLDTGNGATLALPFTLNGSVAAVPEPATVSMMLAGGLAVFGLARRRRQSR